MVNARLKQIAFPQFFPDATLGVVRGVTPLELKIAGIEGVVVNTFHLRHSPGLALLSKLGGVKPLMNWPGLVTSDSGGFQLFSLIKNNPLMGKIIDEGVVLYSGKNRQKKYVFTPEESIRVQFAIGSDMMVCLDDFTPPEANAYRAAQSVERTIAWAHRSKAEFEKQIQIYGYNDKNRPLLIAPIQGHNFYNLRQKCTQELATLKFDIYGLGGWPFQTNGQFDYEMCQRNNEGLPADSLLFALGVGSPENIVCLNKFGYHFFDCVLPTRDARHQRLYVFNQDPAQIDFDHDSSWYHFLYLNRAPLAQSLEPVSPYCDCFTCQHHSAAYLHHLFKIKDALAYRLATLHNLHFYARLMQELQKRRAS